MRGAWGVGGSEAAKADARCGPWQMRYACCLYGGARPRLSGYQGRLRAVSKYLATAGRQLAEQLDNAENAGNE